MCIFMSYQRWSLFLSEFNVKLVHISGTKMVQSDALSRRPDFTLENDNDNEDITMLPKNLFIHLIDTDLQNRIAECKDMDKDATEALITLLDQKSTSLRTGLEDWTMEKFGDKNILFQRQKLHSQRWNLATRHCEDVSWPRNSRTPWGVRNVQRYWATLLVAGSTYLCQKLHAGMWRMSTVQDWQTSFETGIFTYGRGKIDKTLCQLLHGSHHGPSIIRRVWLHLGCSRSRS